MRQKAVLPQLRWRRLHVLLGVFLALMVLGDSTAYAQEKLIVRVPLPGFKPQNGHQISSRTLEVKIKLYSFATESLGVATRMNDGSADGYVLDGKLFASVPGMTAADAEVLKDCRYTTLILSGTVVVNRTHRFPVSNWKISCADDPAWGATLGIDFPTEMVVESVAFENVRATSVQGSSSIERRIRYLLDKAGESAPTSTPVGDDSPQSDSANHAPDGDGNQEDSGDLSPSDYQAKQRQKMQEIEREKAAAQGNRNDERQHSDQSREEFHEEHVRKSRESARRHEEQQEAKRQAEERERQAAEQRRQQEVQRRQQEAARRQRHQQQMGFDADISMARDYERAGNYDFAIRHYRAAHRTKAEPWIQDKISQLKRAKQAEQEQQRRSAEQLGKAGHAAVEGLSQLEQMTTKNMRNTDDRVIDWFLGFALWYAAPFAEMESTVEPSFGFNLGSYLEAYHWFDSGIGIGGVGAAQVAMQGGLGGDDRKARYFGSYNYDYAVRAGYDFGYLGQVELGLGARTFYEPFISKGTGEPDTEIESTEGVLTMSIGNFRQKGDAIRLMFSTTTDFAPLGGGDGEIVEQLYILQIWPSKKAMSYRLGFRWMSVESGYEYEDLGAFVSLGISFR